VVSCRSSPRQGGAKFAVNGLKTDQGKFHRMFKVYQCQSGRKLGSLTDIRIDRPAWFLFDRGVKILAVPLTDGKNLVSRFNLPGLEYQGVTKAEMACLGPDARWSMNFAPDQPPALALYDVATGLPLMRMAQDVDASKLSFNFSPDGRRATIGRRDGTVSVQDLVEINKQLTKLGLGW
jgi:hypothetical protein